MKFEEGDGATILINPDHIVAIYSEVYRSVGTDEIMTESAVIDVLGKVWNVKGTVRELIKSLRLST